MSRRIAAIVATLALTGTAAAAPLLQPRHHVSPLAMQASAENDTMAPGGGATLNQPLGLALDHAGNLYVANLNTGVTIYNPKLQLTGRISVSLPTAIGVNFTADRIMVTSGANYAISIFDQNYNPVGTITDPSLRYPLSLYVDGNDATWLLDNAGVVHAYLNDGTPAGSINVGGGTAVGPFGSNWSVWGVPNGDGTYNEWYGNLGQALHSGPSITAGFRDAPFTGGVVEDAQSNQYVTDEAHKAVIAAYYPGSSIGTIINTPASPYGIAVDSVRNRIYISFSQANIINVYGLKSYKLLKTLH